MSYWVYLQNEKKEPVTIEFHEKEGGTYVFGGSLKAELNITYNYSSFYYQHLDGEKGLKWLNGRKAKDCIERLKYVVQTLGVKQDEDYWKATAGNAGYALSILLAWAKEHKENKKAIFVVE